jgi:uncharacterized protein (TIGR03437 family)
MKCILVLFVCAATLSAQAASSAIGHNTSFATGQAARALIGQTTFTSQDPNSSDVIVGAVSGLAYAADTLFVADANRVGATPSNHRVLLYQGVSSMLPSPQAQLSYDSKCPVCVGHATTVLGQPDFASTTENIPASRNNLRLPTAVASDGVRVVIADTNHNRVLIWNHIPSVNNQQADVVIGQPDFIGSGLPPNNTPTAKSLRGPQGVWIQNGKLFVADTQNNRVLIFNSIPTTNGVAADVVVGAPDFTTFVQPDLTQQTTAATASNLLNPVSVTSDGVRLFVTDLGYNRVLIWNTIPTSNGAPANIAIGQPDMTSSVANNGYSADANGVQTPVMCPTITGSDVNGNNTYSAVCNSTLNFPRFALAAGGRLFVADGGNDRVLVFNQIPTQTGASADNIIGQIGGTVDQASDAADSLRNPMSLAWDGTNLYVSDAFNRRITVYSIAPTLLPYQAVRNSAAIDIYANGTVTIGVSTTVTAGDIITITLGYNDAFSRTPSTCTSAASATTAPGPATAGTCIDYTYTVKSTDTLADIVTGLVNSINTSFSGAGDPNVFATSDFTTNQVVLTSRVAGDTGNNVTLSTKVSSGATETATASGTNLKGGGDAAKIAPGTIVSILAADGTTLTDQNASADPNQNAPTTLGGVQVYVNGIPSPVLMVSPTQINAQLPWEISDSTSVNAYVRAVLSDGTVSVTSPVAVSIVPANPGVYSQPGTDPSLAQAYHGSSRAVGILDVEGTATPGDIVTATIEDRNYNYTVLPGDTLESIRNALVQLLNADPKVTAEASGEYTRIAVYARVEGPDGNNIPYAASASSGATEIMTAFTAQLCCANVEGAPVTFENPALPGEFIVVYATGLGLPVITDANRNLIATGQIYPLNGPVTSPTTPSAVSSIVGGKTADVITATLMPGTVGVYKVLLHLNSDIPTNNFTSLTIAQDIYVSKVTRIQVVNPSGQ